MSSPNPNKTDKDSIEHDGKVSTDPLPPFSQAIDYWTDYVQGSVDDKKTDSAVEVTSSLPFRRSDLTANLASLPTSSYPMTHLIATYPIFTHFHHPNTSELDMGQADGRRRSRRNVVL
ncbi:hypothetical protein DFJ43DRAFT_1157344 [Lentinula guzmanii]|uniref:Uncharacterized protein n=1 Tax=Lentinula guzmanii TaxID=2804957 RepID=A0AA38J5W4_9AGAR|nr:hypothetical protein DFJ43DRAFT_1157344 [Lentinula guzmanii]